MTLWFTSDTHFADSRVLKIDRRPFANMAEHDGALIANWNALVAPEDEIWHLGDFARGTTEEVEAVLAQLHGTKHLVIGNNDPEPTLSAKGWASLQHYREMRIDGQLFILCHYPFRTWNQIGKKSINLHGHSHGKLTPVTRQFDVGVDPQGLRPRRIEEIVVSRRKTKAG
ncbi:metallophosphoesterase family protein [Devosia rhizoryzae]|uniref:Metallophosphoesterase family protein n=1 Tax=Devosia rhizoryzae TaxID=2774137 RepID=A0ABX7C4N6_9HYPH|nr:metallophosphoesterase family protein [Devosia rhizoryzae]QQR38199.1 metallophosphoesterase family protein [Devosia rhizoryzae]